ncbi:KEOPS complex subunit Pcc1 [Natrialba sp. PRR66]|uniref:KEOPS complex subunit Pcc1 n=1 Tax=Natrialba sp. PRR66 TaxID=3098146 RepID=UPI002B1CF3BB|nr:KEOPS complex subunit Pcc1 [Natrialba sp. PRR66]
MPSETDTEMAPASHGRATIRTHHDDPELVARALRPDNTDEMETVVADETTVVTRIERETTGGLHSTVDDYVVNLEVAVDVARTVRDAPDGRDGNSAGTDAPDAPPADATEQYDDPADTGTVSDADTTTQEHNE